MSVVNPELPNLPSDSFLVDTHCHLDMDDFVNDLDIVISRALSNGIIGIVTIGIDLKSSCKAVDLARQHLHVRAAAGIHPHDVEHVDDRTLDQLVALIRSNSGLIVGFGEIGLDYFKRRSRPEQQRDLFAKQLQIAKSLNLPVIIHDREAHDDCLDILRAEGPFPSGGIMHCFSGNLSLARKVMDLNMHISIPGIVTFKNATDLQEVAAGLPLERMLLETDGPFLAPTPFRGKRNEPRYTLFTAAAVARIRSCTIGEIARATTRNASLLFRHDFCSLAMRTP